MTTSLHSTYGSVPRFGARATTGGLAVRLQRFLRGKPAPLQHKAIELSFRPMLPMVLAGSALLYNQGQETNKGPLGEKNAWIKMLAESGLAYAVLANTTGLYSLFGVCLAAFRAGRQETRLDQMKSIVNTAVTLSMGAAGVNLFKHMSHTDQAIDDVILHEALRLDDKSKESKAVKTWVETLKAHNEPEARQLGQTLQQLGDTLKQKNKHWENATNKAQTTAFKEKAEQLKQQLDTLKNEAIEQFEKVESTALNLAKTEEHSIINNLMSSIRYASSGFVKANRALNPVFGYIISGLLIGTPIAQVVNKLLSMFFPSLAQKSSQQSLLPPQNRIVNGAPPMMPMSLDPYTNPGQRFV